MPRELHHNTPEQTTVYVKNALKVLEVAKVPDDLREVAFTGVLNLLSSKQVFIDQADVSPVLRGVPGINH